MKASYNWLKDFCDFGLSPHELAQQLGNVGFNVESVERCGEDWTLEVEVTTNRPDCLCHLGLAREIAAICGLRPHQPRMRQLQERGPAFSELARVEVHAPELCPHYTARAIVGVRVGPSPAWLQSRLAACGLRPVNNVVDATNYVMLECGQPLHAFDLERVEGGTVLVRRAQKGETIVTIDGRKRELSGEECVIADSSRPIALAGVMGGLDCEIRDSTRNLLIESARFDPRSIRRTSRYHGLVSDSSYRFERGVDPQATQWASQRVCDLIVQLAGGKIAKGAANILAEEPLPREVTMRHRRLELILGQKVPQKAVGAIFRGLGLKVLSRSRDGITVCIPSWRADLTREIDLIEEVARIWGYDKIGRTTAMPVRAVGLSTAERAARRARRLLAGAGFYEVMSHSLICPSPLQLAQPWHDGQPLALRNPVSTDRTHMRLTNMGNLALIKQYNQAHQTFRVDLFELGPVYLPTGPAQQPNEKQCLTLLTDRENGLRVLKGVLLNLLEELGVEGQVRQTPRCAGPFDPEQALVIHMDDALLGCAGVLAAEFVKQLDLANSPAIMELDFGLIAQRCRLQRPVVPIIPYPATRRDIAVVVDESILWADLERCILQSAPATVESVELFDVYRGHPVPAGRKSIAFSMTFRCPDRTITAAEADEGRAAVVRALQEAFGAVVR